MQILIFALILILVVGLAMYLIDGLPFDSTTSRLLKAVIALIAIILLINRAGLI